MTEFNRASMRPRAQAFGIIVDELLVLDIAFESVEHGISLNMPEFWC